MFRVRVEEAGEELRPDLVGVAPDGRPSTAVTRSRRAPSRSIADSTASPMPVKEPFQPECAAPITRASRSAKRIGPQSADRAASATPGRDVTIASAFGRSPGQGPRTSTTSAECTWCRLTSQPGFTPSLASIRARFSRTASGASPEPGPPFSEA